MDVCVTCRTNFLCLYLIDTDGPSINLLTTIPAVDTICASCVGGNLVAYETRPGWGNMNVEPGLFHVRNVTTSSADPVVQATFSVGNTLVCDAIFYTPLQSDESREGHCGGCHLYTVEHASASGQSVIPRDLRYPRSQAFDRPKPCRD